MKDCPSQSGARPAPSRLLRHELVDIGGYGFVESIFLAVELERDRVCVAVREQTPAFKVLQIFLETAQRPGTVTAKSEYVFAD